MARIVRAALALGAGLAALVGGATTANAAENTYIQLGTADGSLCLGAAPGNATYLDLCRTDWLFPAVWQVVPTADSSFELRWESNGDCLEVADSGIQAGAAVRLGTCAGGKQTHWQMDLVDPVRKLYQLRPTHTQNRCLDIPDSDMVQGKPVQQWTCNQSDAQLWRVERLQWTSA
ncbi:RICIN domain-containing protein [Streptomyces halstedii]|uniref:RICIN domain-containing protein n=1 Tax=Streptomyces halstedii TaxID=1944 RepID=A0A6N9U7E6_STRHA|nr:RICIN domain-containing protein [Streptomyces halstedii]NEA19794.1 RICIN domain-containing protein [Streptomyces halstedii]